MNKFEFTEYAEMILLHLKKGEWTEISEVIRAVDLSKELTEKILEFLEISNFIEFDNERKRIKINKLGKSMLNYT